MVNTEHTCMRMWCNRGFQTYAIWIQMISLSVLHHYILRNLLEHDADNTKQLFINIDPPILTLPRIATWEMSPYWKFRLLGLYTNNSCSLEDTMNIINLNGNDENILSSPT